MRSAMLGWMIQGMPPVVGSPQFCTHRSRTSDWDSHRTSSMLTSGASVLASRSSMYTSPPTSQTRLLNSASVMSAMQASPKSYDLQSHDRLPRDQLPHGHLPRDRLPHD